MRRLVGGRQTQGGIGPCGVGVVVGMARAFSIMPDENQCGAFQL